MVTFTIASPEFGTVTEFTLTAELSEPHRCAARKRPARQGHIQRLSLTSNVRTHAECGSLNRKLSKLGHYGARLHIKKITCNFNLRVRCDGDVGYDVTPGRSRSNFTAIPAPRGLKSTVVAPFTKPEPLIATLRVCPCVPLAKEIRPARRGSRSRYCQASSV